MSNNNAKKFANPVAAEIDHLAEDLLDTASSIERLTRKFSEDMQALLQRQAQDIKAYAEACERGDEPKH
jgi:hypothetical protein